MAVIYAESDKETHCGLLAWPAEEEPTVANTFLIDPGSPGRPSEAMPLDNSKVPGHGDTTSSAVFEDQKLKLQLVCCFG